MTATETRRTQLLAAIGDHWRQHGFSPSNRELARQLGVSVATVNRDLADAKEAGELDYRPRCPRTIRLLEREPAGT